jgi:hypothetical protein
MSASPTIYRWRVRTQLPERFGQHCHLLRTGKLNSALVEFIADGARVVTCRYYIRAVRA